MKKSLRAVAVLAVATVAIALTPALTASANPNDGQIRLLTSQFNEGSWGVAGIEGNAGDAFTPGATVNWGIRVWTGSTYTDEGLTTSVAGSGGTALISGWTPAVTTLVGARYDIIAWEEPSADNGNRRIEPDPVPLSIVGSTGPTFSLLGSQYAPGAATWGALQLRAVGLTPETTYDVELRLMPDGITIERFEDFITDTDGTLTGNITPAGAATVPDAADFYQLFVFNDGSASVVASTPLTVKPTIGAPATINVDDVSAGISTTFAGFLPTETVDVTLAAVSDLGTAIDTESTTADSAGIGTVSVNGTVTAGQLYRITYTGATSDAVTYYEFVPTAATGGGTGGGATVTTSDTSITPAEAAAGVAFTFAGFDAGETINFTVSGGFAPVTIASVVADGTGAGTFQFVSATATVDAEYEVELTGATSAKSASHVFTIASAGPGDGSPLAVVAADAEISGSDLTSGVQFDFTGFDASELVRIDVENGDGDAVFGSWAIAGADGNGQVTIIIPGATAGETYSGRATGNSSTKEALFSIAVTGESGTGATPGGITEHPDTGIDSGAITAMWVAAAAAVAAGLYFLVLVPKRRGAHSAKRLTFRRISA